MRLNRKNFYRAYVAPQIAKTSLPPYSISLGKKYAPFYRTVGQ